MPRENLDNIPAMAASTWTGAPAEIFYGMYYDDKPFEDAMADFSSFVMTEYGEEPGFEEDEFAVEKSLYQIEMAGGADPQTLSSTAGMLTPWGPGLEIPEIESVLSEYPAVEVGFNANNTDLMDDADAVFNHPAFTGAADRIEDEAEDRGLLGDIGAFFSGVGEKIGEAFEDYGDALVSRGEATQAVGSGALDMGERYAQTLVDTYSDAMDIVGQSAMADIEGTQALGGGFLDMAERYAQTVGEHLEHNALVEQSGTEIQLFGGESEQTRSRLDEIEDRELKRADFREWDQKLNSDVTGLIAFFGDEQNYANGTLDRETVMEWIEGLIASPLGSSDREIGLTLRETVNQSQRSAIKIDQTEETAQAFTPDEVTPMEAMMGRRSTDQGLDDTDRGFDDTPIEDPFAPPPNIQAGWGADVGVEDIEAGDDLLEQDGTGTGALEEEAVVGEEEAVVEGESDWSVLGDAPYYDRFLREFNRRPGSGRSEYQNRIGGLYNEADMLYWLHEPWSSREWEKAGFAAYDADPATMGRKFSDDGSAVKSVHERDNYSRWITGFLNSPDDFRGDNFYAAVEDLRDTMAGYEGKSETEMGAIRAQNVDDGYKWLQFMDPNTPQSGDRLTRAIARYNAPPDADANFNNMQFRYYSNLLRNWEAAGKTRESFLNAFTSQRPSYSPAQ